VEALSRQHTAAERESAGQLDKIQDKHSQTTIDNSHVMQSTRVNDQMHRMTEGISRAPSARACLRGKCEQKDTHFIEPAQKKSFHGWLEALEILRLEEFENRTLRRSSHRTVQSFVGDSKHHNIEKPEKTQDNSTRK
jgi:hypothetical protein